MSITKQTDRAQIQNYSNTGISLFNQIEAGLLNLVGETAVVAYKGANALAFKTKCTSNAVEFANTCSQNMQQMSDIITQACTFIASALGGAVITLDPPTMVVDLPAIDADTSVESATDGPLRDLAMSTGRIYDAVEQSFAANLQAFTSLGATGWVGPEYDDALGQIQSLTTAINASIANSRSVMVADINNQLTALGFAAA